MRVALHAEWTKLRTAPGTFGLLLATIVATAGVSVAVAASVRCPTAGCGLDATRVSLTGVQLGQSLVAIVAVLAVGAEYGTGMIRTTLAALPRRGHLLAAKAVVVVAPTTLAAVLGVAASVLFGRWVMRSHGIVLPALTDPGVLRAGFGSVLYLALIALLSVGVTAMARTPAAGIGIVLGLLYLFPVIALAASDPDWQRHLKQLGPSSAGLGIQATVDLSELPLRPWTGLAVTAAWAVGALIGGALLLRFRDAGE
jgi:ABC-2 type transport system permease protein